MLFRALVIACVVGALLGACKPKPAEGPATPGAAAPEAGAMVSVEAAGELMPSTDENALPGDGMARGPATSAQAPAAAPAPAPAPAPAK